MAVHRPELSTNFIPVFQMGNGGPEKPRSLSFQCDRGPATCSLPRSLRMTVSCSASNSNWVRNQDFHSQGLRASHISSSPVPLKIPFLSKLPRPLWRWEIDLMQMAAGWAHAQNGHPPQTPPAPHHLVPVRGQHPPQLRLFL